MTLFLILLCLGLQRQLGLNPKYIHSWSNIYWTISYKLSIKWRLGNNVFTVLLLLSPLIIIVALAEFLLKGIWFNSLNFLFQGVVLFFCLNACSVKKTLTNYLKAREEENKQAAFQYGLNFLEKTTVTDLVTLTRAITQRIFWHSDIYLFSVLFWHLVLGPVAIVIYASIRFLVVENSHFYISAQKIHAVLDWLPTRITALSYALAGHFAYAFAGLRRHLFASPFLSPNISLEVGLAALERNKNDVALADQGENLAALALVDRSLMIWLVAIAIFTLTAWIA